MLHPERGEKRALRMIFMCSQGSEQGKSFISVRLGHVTRIVIDGFDYQLQPRIDECALLGDRDPRATYIEPLMSAKSVVTILRCPSSEASGGSPHLPVSTRSQGRAAFLAFRGALRTRYRIAVGEFSVLQERQRRINSNAHSPQNFDRSGFSPPHFEQCMAPLPLEAYRASGF